MGVEQDKFVTEKEVSKLTGIALSTLRNDRARAGRRRFPYRKIGKSVRYYLPEVLAVMNARVIGNKGEQMA